MKIKLRDEIKELFANESLEKLQTLYFDFKTEKKKTKKKQKNN